MKFSRRRRNRRSKQPTGPRQLGFESLEDRCLLAAVAWDGGGDGTSWHDPLNWDTDALPTSVDDVTIDVPGNVTVVVNSISDAPVVNSIQSNEFVQISAGNLAVNAASAFAAGVSVSSGSLTGSGDITLGGSSVAGAATIGGTGSLAINSGASLRISSLGSVNVERATEIFGTLRIGSPQSGSAVTRLSLLGTGDRLVVRPGGTLHLVDAGRISGSAGSRVLNEGTLRYAGAGEVFEVSTELVNQGTMDIVNGRLKWVGGGSTTTSINIPAAATLELSGGFGFGTGTSLTGDGTLKFFSGTYDFSNAQFLPTGTVEFRSGTTTIANTLPAALSVPFISGTVIFNADQVLDSNTFTLATLGGSGDLTLAGNSLLNGLTLTGTGSATIATGADMSVGSFNATFRRVVDNFGKLRANADRVSLDATWTNRPGSEFILNSGGQLGRSNSPTATFVNQGTFAKIGTGLSEVLSGVHLQNDGMLAVADGPLRFAASSQLQNLNAATLSGGEYFIASTVELFGASAIDVIDADLTLSGPNAHILTAGVDALAGLDVITSAGRLAIERDRDFVTAGDLLNDGQLAIGPASDLQVNGFYSQTAAAAFTVGIGGRPASGQFGTFTSSQNVTLDGAFEVQLLDGFGPSSGDVYQVMTFPDSQLSDFAQRNGLFLGRTQAFDVVTNSTDVTVNAVASAADLAVDQLSLVHPSQADVGDTIQVQYTAQNISGQPISGDWVDSVYLSTDNVLNSGDKLLQRINRTGGLGVGAGYTESIETTLPGLIEANYRLIVVADSRGLVPDSDRTSNTAVSPGIIQTTFPSLQLGTTLSDLVTDGQDVYLRLDVPDGIDIRLTVSLPGSDQAELFVRHGGVASRSAFDQRGNPRQASQELMLSGRGGTYYLLLHGLPAAGGGASFSLTAEAVGLDLRSVSPSRGSNLGTATTRLSGSGFSPHSQVDLLDVNGTVQATAEVVFHDRQNLVATFDLTGLAAGEYAVRVSDSGRSSQLDGVYDVTTGPAGKLDLRLSAPGGIFAGRMSSATVTYRNSGDTDIPIPVLTITADNALLRMAGDVAFERQVLQVVGMDPENPADTLPPGAEGHVVIEFRAIDSTIGEPISIAVDGPDANGTPLDLAAVKNDFRPQHFDLDAWDAVFDNFQMVVGDTVGGFNQMVAENAGHVARSRPERSVSRLVQFELLQANNALGPDRLVAIRDAQAPAPGAPLVFERVYRKSISSRFQLGALGRGWMHNWETRLSRDAHGNFTFLGGAWAGYFIALEDDRFAAAGDDGEAVMRRTLTHPTDPQQNELTVRMRDGSISVFQEGDGRLLRHQDTHGNLEELQYAGDQLVRVEHSSGAAFDLTYNGAGRLASLTDQAARVTTYTYDTANEHLISVQGPRGTARYAYDSATTGPRQHALRSVENPDNTHEFIDYDSLGRLIELSRDAGAERLTFGYPRGGMTTTNAAGATTSLAFNQDGLITEVIDADGEVVHFAYDALRRMTEIVDQAGLRTSFSYDSFGNVLRTTDAAGHSTRQSFQAPTLFDSQTVRTCELTASGTVSCSDSLLPGNVASPTPVNRLASHHNELGIPTTYDYGDGLRDLVETVFADGSAESFAHDGQGNVIQTINRRGQSRTITYDSRGLPIRTDHEDGTFEAFTYDNRGNVLTASGPLGTTSLSYDDADRLLQQTDAHGRFLQYEYNSGGQVLSVLDQDGFQIRYEYDAAGRVTTLRDGSSSLLSSYEYDATGRVARHTLGNGAFSLYEYDAAGRITAVENHTPAGTTRSRVDYAYDRRGLLTQATSPAGVTDYGYDALGQLSTVQLPDGRVIQYDYDAAGNRLRVVDDGVITAYQTNPLDQYTQVGTTLRHYDNDGNLIQQVGLDGEQTLYHYDDTNQLIRLESSSGVWVYQYDAFGNRQRTDRDGTATVYQLDPRGLVSLAGEYDEVGNLTARYVHGPTGPIVRLDGAGNSLWYEMDTAPGSATALLDAAGNPVASYSYLPFGVAVETPPGVANPFQFAGRYGVTQEDNGLVSMRRRFYEPATGAFLSADPLRTPREMYLYARNNPLQIVDPKGESSEVPTLPPNVAGVALSGATEASGVIRGAGSVAGGIASGAAGALGAIALGSNEDTYRGVEGLVRQGKCGTINVNACELSQEIDQVGSFDPNDIIGPAGFGEENFLQPGLVMPYTIRFENLATATAPAQVVEIVQPLDPDLDFATFELGDIRFGDTVVDVPAGLSHYEVQVRNLAGVLVHIVADFNASTGLATWEFRTVDPVTLDLPSDPLGGFLPPNTDAPAGEGSVSYSIASRSELATGARIDAAARIFFDENAPIDTPTAFNTIDAGSPTSQVEPLSPVLNVESFTVRWTGADDHGGAGVTSFDVYVSTDGGDFALWQEFTTADNAVFAGQFGSTYSFFSLARDGVGNVQSLPGSIVTTELQPPDGDFDDDGDYDLDDIDVLMAQIASGAHPLLFDLTGDLLVDLADRDAWLLEAGEFNIGPGRSYLLGDANLDGNVDVADFNIWNVNKFTTASRWSRSDFNGDGITDVSDFGIWNTHKFTSAYGDARSPSALVGGTSHPRQDRREDRARGWESHHQWFAWVWVSEDSGLGKTTFR